MLDDCCQWEDLPGGARKSVERERGEVFVTELVVFLGFKVTGSISSAQLLNNTQATHHRFYTDTTRHGVSENMFQLRLRKE